MSFLKKHERFFPIITVVFFLFLASQLFWLPAQGCDQHFHVARIYQLASELKNGTPFPVRIYTGQNGYASPLFYCDFLLYPSALLVNAGVEISHVYNLLLICISFFAAFFMWICAYYITHNQTKAWIAAFCYISFPWLTFETLVRSGLSGALAIPFVPLVFTGMYGIFHLPPCKKNILLLAFGMSGLIITHLISAAIVCGILAFWFCLEFLFSHCKRRIFLETFFSALICLGLTAFFVFPLFEQLITGSFQVFTGLSAQNQKWYAETGLNLHWLFSSTQLDWLPRYYDSWLDQEKPNLLGIWTYPGMTGWFMLLLIPLIYRFWPQRKRHPHILYLLAALLFIFILTLRLPWNSVLNKVFTSLQFPWRFLVVVAALFAFFCMETLPLLSSRGQKAIACSFAALGIFFISSFTGLFWADAYVKDDFPYYLSLIPSKIGQGEYVPYKDPSTPSVDPQSILSIEELSFSGGKASLSPAQWNNGSSTYIELPLYHYYGYSISDDSDESVPFTISEEGQLLVDVSSVSPSSSISVRYSGTLLQKASLTISTICLFLTAAWGIFPPQKNCIF